ncbi:MAG: Eco57I restriction-modification methylase domain-containing protein [Pseudomonadota bacterium]
MARNRNSHGFTAIRIEGAILPPEFLSLIAMQSAKHQSGADYGLTKSLSLKDELARYWRIANDLYAAYTERRERQDLCPIKVGVEDWLVPLLRDVLSFDDLTPTRPVGIGDRQFLITHQAFSGTVPVLLTTRQFDLDRADSRFGEEGRRCAPHGVIQEFLNASDDVLWGITANGAKLRVLRDNPSLTRPAYFETDLDLIFGEQLYSDFAALWLTLHASRFKLLDGKPSGSILERWRAQAHETGERALKHLREGVTEALRQLGNGFLQHPANESLRTALSNGKLTEDRYFQELLRLVYRLLFMFTAEERGLLHAPTTTTDQRTIFAEAYSLARLRDRALKRRHYDRHPDLWQGLLVLFRALERGESRLGLPALGGLFDRGHCQQLDAGLISNERLLQAIRALAYFRTSAGLARVNYRDMGTEELGSVYESLLELHPRLDVNASPWRFGFANDAASGDTQATERRLSGSYYTPDTLVQELLRSSLDPLVADTIARNPADPVGALLALRVIDPACGSGHFLLAAARRLAAEIAKLQAGSDTPDEAARQHALREVVRHCIYGVDRNPLAVELCRTALWIETVEPGKPLTFLDSHIRTGDSLVGITDLSLLRDGIPDEAYKALSGDSKEVAAHFRKLNKNERDKRPSLDIAGPPKDLADALLALDAMPEDSVADIEAKRAKFEGLRSGGLGWRMQRACDLWVAAFFALKVEVPATRGRELVPTTDKIWQYLRGVTLYGPLMGEADRLAQHYRFFHWPLEFSDVMAKGGFDLVLGNPPWETMSPDAKEFFAVYDHEVRSMSPEDQEATYSRLLETPAIAKRWDAYCRDLYAQAQFYRESGRYRLFAPGNLGKGDLNVYRMFMESALALVRPGGCATQLVPDGLYNGANAAAIRQFLFDECRLIQLIGFQNLKRIWFPEIYYRMKFCLYTAIRNGRTESFNASFGVLSAEQLPSIHLAALRIPVSLVREFSPDAMAIMEFAAQEDIDICRKMYDRYPKFGENIDGLPYRHYMREVDMGTDRELFSENPDGLPVFEGRMVDSYDYRAKGYASGRGRSADWVDLPFGAQHKSIQPQWRIRRDLMPDKLLGRIEKYRIGFCDVASATNARSLISTVLPAGSVSGHKVPTIVFDGGSSIDTLLWVGVSNALCVDFLVRKKVALTMSYTIMDTLPFPRDWRTTPSAKQIAERVLALCAVGDEMEGFRRLVHKEDDVPCSDAGVEDASQRARLMAEIDVLVAHEVYGLSREEMLYILDPANLLGEDCSVETFKALRNREIRDCGEYRTQVLILEAWDRLERGALRDASAPAVVAPPPRVEVDPATLSDGAWARPLQDQRAETGALLAALLKAMNHTLPARQVRLAAALALEPRLLLPHLGEHEEATWRRLVGSEVDPLPDSVAQFVARTDQAWGDAIRNLRGNGHLIEDSQAGTWASGTGLDAFNTAGWPDGRARMVLDVLPRMSTDKVVAALPEGLRGWINGAA